MITLPFQRPAATAPPADLLDLKPEFREGERRGLWWASWGHLIAALVLTAVIFEITAETLRLWSALMGGLIAVLAIARLWLFRASNPVLRAIYPILLLETVILTIAVVAPNPFSDDPWPRQTVYRQGYFVLLFLPIVSSAFSYRPRVVLWAGFCAALCWSIAAAVVYSLPDTVIWDARPDDVSLLDWFYQPHFVDIGGRVFEVAMLLVIAGLVALAVLRSRMTVRRLVDLGRERDGLARAFGRYVPAPIIQRLAADRGQLAAQTGTATILHADIQGFTRFAEGRDPQAVMAAIDRYFGAIGQAVTEEGGVVYQFMGDAVLASFNLPIAIPDHRRAAIRAARRIQAVGRQLLTIDDQPAVVRIGISTGPVTAGLVGGGGGVIYTIYGDTVNLAARLDTMNKQLGTTVLADEATVAEYADDGDGAREVGRVEIRGRQEPVRVYALDRAEPATASAAE